MNYPGFFNDIEHIVLKDDLSAFLGTTDDGMVDISYLEITKMAGHSCATVAGAYLMALKGLKALYGTGIPKRGEIKVELRETLADGNTGVVGTVLSNITGATTDFGFGGLQGMFNRRGLLFYGAAIDSNVRFTRNDTGKSVEVKYNPQKVVAPKEIIMSMFGPNATEESKRTFPKRWQEMVKALFDEADSVIEVVGQKIS
ncbi:MAG: hypothetical protein GXO89_14710 [Chlorobi bacterium]|nr:hypothetical protein [Chlorobiota bacterium]